MPLSDAALLDILRDRVETGRSAGIVVGLVDRGQARTVS
jgi:hypothetical protein